MATQIEQSKKVILTQAQFDARKTAGTLVQGVEYEITDAKTDETDLSSALQTKINSKSTVSGTNDGTNWQTITIDGTTKNIPSGGSVQKDNITITENSSSQLQTVAIIDQKTNTADKIWTGTLAEYNAITNKDNNTYYNVIDDVSTNGVNIVQTTGTSQSNVMSQKATTDALALSSINNQVFPIESIFSDMSSGSAITTCTSVDRYLLSQTANIIISDFKLTNGNIFGGDAWLKIQADANNYMSFSVEGYNSYFRLVINGVVDKIITIPSGTGTYWNELSYARTSWVEFDFILKQIRIRAKLQNGTIKTCLSQDISDWNLSNLSEFNIITSVSNHYTGKVAVKNVRINNNIAPEWMANRILENGNYITLDTITPPDVGGSIDGSDIYLLLGGTIQETIDAKHKITLANSATYSYFGIGATSTLYGSKQRMRSVFKVKFTNMSDNFKFGPSGPCRDIFIINPDTGETVADWSNRLGHQIYGEDIHNGWKPDEDTWYLIYQGCDNSLSYSASYSWYLLGSATIEAIAIGCIYPSAMNLCAANYNGKYFTGNIPFSTNIVPALILPNWNSINYPVKKAITFDDNTGNIAMYNGTTWKQINNS